MSAPTRYKSEQEVQEDLVRLDAYRAQLNAMVQQFQYLASSRTDHVRAREALEGRGFSVQYLDGQTPPAERKASVEAFQRGEGDVFLISLKAGGTGLNLTAADHVIHLDPWWNPAVEDQATDRAHRIGQTKVVTTYRLIAKGTIEEKILELAEKKRELVGAVLSEDVGGAKKLTKSDLEDLFKSDH